MGDFTAARETVGAALRSGRIGTPVAVRIVAHQSADHGSLERAAAAALAAATRWLDSPLERLTALGDVRSGQISVLAQYAGGQTALVSAGSRGVGQPVVEILVTGNRGVLSWEGQQPAVVDNQQGEPSELSDEAARLLERIRQAQRSQSTVAASRATKASRWAPKPRPLKPPYGVLLVAGDHTHQPAYAAGLAADPRAKLIGLCDEGDVAPRRRELNAALAERMRIPVLADLGKALARDDVHVVSICAEPRRRGRIIVRAAQAGKHLYLDKPLAGSLADADRIVAAVERARVVSQMWSLVRTPAAIRCRELVQSGQLGELAAVHLDLTFAKGPAGTARLGTPRRETEVPDVYELPDSKRELSNVGVYPLVMLLWLTGRGVRRVRATTGNYFFAEHQRNDMEDFGQMLLELDAGIVATISAGRTGWKSHPAGGLNRVCLVGSRQAAVVDAHRPRAAAWADAEPWSAPKRDPDDPMGMWGGPKDETYAPRPKLAWSTPPAAAGTPNDFTHFLDCVEDGRQSDVSASLAARATEVLLAAYRSASTGQTIPLPLPRKPT